MKGKVLLVTGNRESGAIWEYALQKRDLTVYTSEAHEEAFKLWMQLGPDLAVIDVETSGRDVIGLCHKLRQAGSNPILVLTGQTDLESMLKIYAAGADESIVTPIMPLLFLAKVEAWLRHSAMPSQSIFHELEVEGWRLEPPLRQIVTPDGRTIRLTGLEFRLLYLLMGHPARPLDSSIIIDYLWGQSGGDSLMLKNVVYRLRRKIQPDSGRLPLIRTVSGQGYSFQPDVTSLDNQPLAPRPARSATENANLLPS